MTEQALRDLVAEFISQHDWISAVVHDTGGLGLCVDASADLSNYLNWASIHAWVLEISLEHKSANPFAIGKRYPRVTGWRADHAVCIVGEWVVDLTARQYDEALPFPMIYRPKWREPHPA